MINHKTLTAIALATTCLTPLAAFAQDAGSNAGTPPAGAATPAPNASSFGALPFGGEAGLGVMGVMGKNPDQAGRYTGLTTKGADAVGQFDLHGASPWNSGGTSYYNLTGDDLVIQTGHDLGSGNSDSSYNRYINGTNNNLANSGDIKLNFGNQGVWSAETYYDVISYTGNTIDSLYTVNGGQARLNNGLAPWGGATAGAPGSPTSFTIPSLMATGAMQPVQTGTRRDIIGGDGKYLWGNWTFTAGVRHEHKEGSLEESFDGPYGGTAFALPIDYDTDRYDVSAAYNTRVNQAVLQYTYSKFSDRNTFVNLPFPASGTAAPYQRSAAYSTPPSSDAHYLTLMVASNAVPQTRINANLRTGFELQDAAFAPDTADPNPSSVSGFSNLNSNLQGTTANSLSDTAIVYQGKISADSHPIANTDARLFYGFDGRNVSLDQYRVYGPGATLSETSFTTANYVVPQNWLKQDAGGEVGYRILPKYDTKLTIAYRFDVIDRSNAEVDHSTTNTETVTLASKFGPQVHSSLTYEHGDRSGSLNYYLPFANLAGYPSASGSSSGVTFSGAYYQAPMTSDTVRLRTDYAVMDNLSAGLFIQFRNENYNYPAVTSANSAGAATSTYPLTGVGEGVKQDYNLTIGPDIGYRPTDDVNLHFFYTYERIYFNNLGNGFCADSNTGVCAGSAGYFQNQYTSAVNSAGVNGEWKVSEKLKLGAEYTVAYGSVMFGEFNGVFVSSPSASYQNVSNYPDIDSLMNNIKLTATYALAPNMDLLVQGGWTYFHNNDWNDTANPAQSTSSTSTAIGILTPGYGSPNYSTATLMTGVKFKF